MVRLARKATTGIAFRGISMHYGRMSNPFGMLSLACSRMCSALQEMRGREGQQTLTNSFWSTPIAPFLLINIAYKE